MLTRFNLSCKININIYLAKVLILSSGSDLIIFWYLIYYIELDSTQFVFRFAFKYEMQYCLGLCENCGQALDQSQGFKY